MPSGNVFANLTMNFKPKIEEEGPFKGIIILSPPPVGFPASDEAKIYAALPEKFKALKGVPVADAATWKLYQDVRLGKNTFLFSADGVNVFANEASAELWGEVPSSEGENFPVPTDTGDNADESGFAAQEQEEDDEDGASDGLEQDYPEEETICVCRNGDGECLVCDSCKGSYHPGCLGLRKMDKKHYKLKSEEFVCPLCTTGDDGGLAEIRRSGDEEAYRIAFKHTGLKDAKDSKAARQARVAAKKHTFTKKRKAEDDNNNDYGSAGGVVKGNAAVSGRMRQQSGSSKRARRK